MSPGTITASIDGPIGTITISNVDRHNAMNIAMYQAVPAAMQQLTSDPSVRAIIVRGDGHESFGAGSDIAEFTDRRLGEQAGEYDDAEYDAWMALAGASVPVLACIHGTCMGGAVALAIHADLRIAAADAEFAIPPARLGVAYPTGAVARLTSLIGPSRAKRLLFTAERFEAATALDMGLVDEVVPKPDLDDHVHAIATTISELSPLAIEAAKISVDHHSIGTPDEAAVAAAVRRCYHSDDFREGITAFLEKRAPEFDGR